MNSSMNPSMKLQVAFFTLTRTVINTLFRMVYPFITAFGRGLGVDFRHIARALSWRSLVGLAGPFIATFADTRGRKAGMAFGLALFALGLGVVIFQPTFLGFTLMLLLTILGKSTFDPSMQAYLGDRVAYQRRGAVLAVTELGWSSAFLVGVPVAGVLIDRFGWRAPFPILVVLGLLALAVLVASLPGDGPGGKPTPSPFANFSRVWAAPAALAGLAATAFVSLSNETVNLVFGVWLEDAFGLQVLALGGASAVIGLSELTGEGVVGFVSDRLGKKRAVTIGLVCNSLAALLLPFLGAGVQGAYLALFLFYLSFEFTFVSSIPMMTEVLPDSRATLMALNLAAASLGRALAAMFAPSLYAGETSFSGFPACALASASINLLALLAVRRVSFAGES